MSESGFLGLISGIIFLGFFVNMAFKRWGIPPTLIIPIFGFALTELLRFFDPDTVIIFAPYFGSMAFAIILFSGVIAIDLYLLFKKLAMATLFTVLTFTLNVILITVLWSSFVAEVLVGVLMGSMVGGTSGAIVIPLAIGVVKGGGTFNFASYLFNPTVNSVILSVIVGFVWFVYYILLAILFGLYWVSDLIGASGPLSAFVFGMTLSNFEKFIEGNLSLDDFTRQISSELSFVSSTFFFFMIGMIMKAVSGFFLLILLARFLLYFMDRVNDAFAIFFMIPRGLAAAIMAINAASEIQSYANRFVSYAFSIR